MAEKNKIAWITGAATGIGRSLSYEFCKNDYDVAGSSRKKTQLERFKAEISELSGTFEVFPLDVTVSDDVVSTCDKIEKSYDINCLINNAGITAFKLAADTNFEEAEAIIQTNLIGSIFTTQAVLPKMIERKSGTIINIISVTADKIFEKSSIYSASKAGLLSYSNVLREEVREHNIKVINIIPGATKTPIWPNEILEKISEKMMSPDDIAKLVFHLFNLDMNIVPEEITLRPITGDL